MACRLRGEAAASARGRMAMTGRLARGVIAVGLLALAGAGASDAATARAEKLTLRGQEQALHVYGTPRERVAIVTSGDGGWVSLGPDVAEHLADAGYYVVGVDAKAYLSSFTHGDQTALDVGRAARLRGARRLRGEVRQGTPGARRRVRGRRAVGPRRHRSRAAGEDRRSRRDGAAGRERARLAVPRLDDLPHEEGAERAALQGARDRRARGAGAARDLPGDARRVRAAGRDERDRRRRREPHRVWTIEAGNHRFGDALPELWRRLEEALAWIAETPVASH